LDRRLRGKTGRREGVDTETLLSLLQIYEAALRELREMNDPALAGLTRQLVIHRAEVIAALAASYMPDDDEG
jgi:hypothetical protein